MTFVLIGELVSGEEEEVIVAAAVLLTMLGEFGFRGDLRYLNLSDIVLVEDNSLFGAVAEFDTAVFKEELISAGVFRLDLKVEPTSGDKTLEGREDTTESVSESHLEYFLFSDKLFIA